MLDGAGQFLFLVEIGLGSNHEECEEEKGEGSKSPLN